jgi:replicative DNA helicase
MQSQGESPSIQIIEPLVVAEELKVHSNLEAAGGLEYLKGLVEACPSSANIDYYIGRILDLSRKRYLALTMQRLMDEAYDPDTSRIGPMTDASLIAINRIRVDGWCDVDGIFKEAIP